MRGDGGARVTDARRSGVVAADAARHLAIGRTPKKGDGSGGGRGAGWTLESAGPDRAGREEDRCGAARTPE